MTNAPQIVDRKTLKTRRKRAKTDALFLQQTAIDEVQDRISMVNRTFTDLAVVTPYPEIWQAAFPAATVVEDADTLDLSPNQYDLVVHGLSLHWANDPVGQIIQCRRALKEDGFFLAVLLGGQTLSELRIALSQAEAVVTGGLSPRIAPMAEIRDLGALLQRSGLNLPVADSFTLTASYRDLVHLMHDLRDMGETNALTDRLRRPTRREVFAQANDIYRAHFPDSDGRIKASFELITLTGWSPSDSQPKPLRPGSAQARLADALNTNEIKLPE